MATAITPLANITLGSSAATVTFSSISGAYRDLYLVAQFGLTSAGQNTLIRFNGDSGTNYHWVCAYGNGSTASSFAGASQSSIYIDPYGMSATTPIGNFLTSIFDYSATDKHKPVLVRGNEAGSITEMTAGRWANTSAITSFVLSCTAGSFATGSTFSLFGVSA